MTASRSPHGERGLKYVTAAGISGRIRRSPHGERGLKSVESDRKSAGRSRSPHGERGLKWRVQLFQGYQLQSRSPHGERGLKSCGPASTVIAMCRSPHGERGLKLTSLRRSLSPPESLPTRGAWIEIVKSGLANEIDDVAPHTGSVD